MKPLVVRLLLVALPLAGQQKPVESRAIPMPPDRAEASYAIYSSLLPLGETASPGWPHEFFLVRDATVTVVKDDVPCQPQSPSPNDFGTHTYRKGYPHVSQDFSAGLNPHSAVRPPDSDMQDYKEILEDFDARCHERIALTADAWTASAPIRLLTRAEQDEFVKSTGSQTPNPKFKGAGTLNSFSQIYFNAKRTVALVYATHFCGGWLEKASG